MTLQAGRIYWTSNRVVTQIYCLVEAYFLYQICDSWNGLKNIRYWYLKKNRPLIHDWDPPPPSLLQGTQKLVYCRQNCGVWLFIGKGTHFWFRSKKSGFCFRRRCFTSSLRPSPIPLLSAYFARQFFFFFAPFPTKESDPGYFTSSVLF